MTGEGALAMHATRIADTYGVSPGVGCSPPVISGTASGTAVICGGPITRIVVQAGGGNDRIALASDPDAEAVEAATATVDLGDGADYVSVPFRVWDSTITGGPGNDELRANDSIGQDAVVYGGSGNDKIYVSPFDSYSYGEIGDDYLFSGILMEGGDGNDTLRGSPTEYSHATMRGGNGNDNIDGGDGNDLVYGGPGADWLEGGGDRDSVFGEAGNDDVFGGYDYNGEYWGDSLYCGPDADRWYTQASEIPVRDWHEATCETYGGAR
jgi:Ca2+-binding RTX toxin-like protein